MIQTLLFDPRLFVPPERGRMYHSQGIARSHTLHKIDIDRQGIAVGHPHLL
ncbi:MAG: hypothetical protein LUO93_09640 [Methanomicrobiales archaeon]|nr:hypothetical protein [Methanomicrobiales archaeon]